MLREANEPFLYVGRDYRVVPPRLRRALEHRDGHCAFPDCRVNVRRCRAHHVQHWEHGGNTDLDNCVLLCEKHHRSVVTSHRAAMPAAAASVPAIATGIAAVTLGTVDRS